jgi:hypothetical protein
MLYTVAEAAKATGFEESIFLRAIDDGQISGTQDQSGEWQVEEDEIHRLYLLVAQQYCKQKYRAGLQTADGTASDAEVAASSSDTDVGTLQQHIDSLGETPKGADQAKTTPTTAPTLGNEIRIDDRDKISISDSRLGGYRTRIRMGFLALGCIAALSSYYFLGQSLVPEQRVNSSAPTGEREAISKSPVEQRSAVDTVGKTPVIGNGIDHAQEGAQTSRAPNPTTAVTNRDATTQQIAPKKGEAKSQAKLVAVPETRPTTIKGWTVRNVVDGTAVVEGPNGIWKVARGDAIPGLGKVESIVLWGNRRIVATNKGLITTR